jgi:hypothetical protein
MYMDDAIRKGRLQKFQTDPAKECGNKLSEIKKYKELKINILTPNLFAI